MWRAASYDDASSVAHVDEVRSALSAANARFACEKAAASLAFSSMECWSQFVTCYAAKFETS